MLCMEKQFGRFSSTFMDIYPTYFFTLGIFNIMRPIILKAK